MPINIPCPNQEGIRKGVALRRENLPTSTPTPTQQQTLARRTRFEADISLTVTRANSGMQSSCGQEWNKLISAGISQVPEGKGTLGGNTVQE
jgi:hypothetical protein